MFACYTYVSVVVRNGCLLVIHMSVWWLGMAVYLLYICQLGMAVCVLYICQCGS